MRLVLISAGATAATRAAAFPRDEPIEALARARAVALGETLGRADRALVSPALAARQTAEALALDAAVDPLLADWDHGRWAGRRLTDVEAEAPHEVAAWLSDPDAAPHGGESLSALCRRVAEWLGGLGAERRVVAVTHQAVIRAAVLHVLDAPRRSFWRIDIDPLSVTELRGGGGRWRLRFSSSWDRA